LYRQIDGTFTQKFGRGGFFLAGVVRETKRENNSIVGSSIGLEDGTELGREKDRDEE